MTTPSSSTPKPRLDRMPDGNAFAIMGAVAKALRNAGQGDQAATYMQRAMSSDYQNLLAVSLEYVDFPGGGDDEEDN